MAFGLFGKKKDNDPQGAGGAENGAAAPAETNPAKARRYFDHAQTVHDSTNYEYAMVLWLQGISQDPSSVEGLDKFMQSSAKFSETNRKPTKDQQGQVKARQPGVQKYLVALLNWGARPLDWASGLDAFEAAVKLGQSEPAYWIGARVLGLAGQDPKAKKATFTKIMDLFTAIGAFDKAVVAGELAARLDPTDAKLVNEVRNMSAQAAMSRGGYEETGASGGFRANIKDLQAQRLKESEERLVKTEDELTLTINAAKADYESRPTDSGAVEKYARLLRERGTPQDEKTAYEVLLKAYQATKVYRFKQQAGDIKLRVARRKFRSMSDALAQEPKDASGFEEKSRQVAAAARQFLELEIEEYAERVENYPTDLSLRYELGRRYLEMGDPEKAVDQLQQAREAPTVANRAMLALAKAFEKLGWFVEAESTYREAIEKHENTNDEMGIELRYGLMSSLEQSARESKKISTAEEALKLASGIAIQKIGYRDIRERRQALQDLVKSLRDDGS